VEKQLLPNPALKPAYEQAVWLYVYRDFSKNDADSAADRVCLRLGLTSYPQHILVDPVTLERLGDTGRAVDSFLAAMNGVHVKKGTNADPVKLIADADARAQALEKSGSAAAAAKALADDDIVVRFRAVEILAEKDPAAIVPKAAELLAVPHDPFRFEVCRALAKAADVKSARALESTLRDAPKSLNPNVLRIESAKALGACGDAASIEVLRPFAASGEYRNGLTGTAVDAIAEIVSRDAKAKAAARAALVAAFPPPATDAAEATMCVALAKRVHAALAKVTGKKVDFPGTYDEASRKKLVAAW
jgi:hypothetical protein